MEKKLNKDGNVSQAHLRRYRKNILVPQIGLRGQQALQHASVFVVGAGGLGCPVIQYLAAAGIGKIGIADFDIVDESNLQRQTLYSMSDIGLLKTESALAKIKSINPIVEVYTYPVKLTATNTLEILKDYDIVIDGSDNFPTRFLINDACVILNKPLVFGALSQFEGQITVFNYKNGPNYRSLVPEYPDCSEAVSCDTSGILGAVAGMIGSMMVIETVKIITGTEGVLSGKLVILDTLTMQFNTINFASDPNAEEITALHDYESLCNAGIEANTVKTVSKSFITERLMQNNDIQIIDLREPEEFMLNALEGSVNLPFELVESRIEVIRRDMPVVLVCNLGIKSNELAERLHKYYGFENILSLEGGILAQIC